MIRNSLLLIVLLFFPVLLFSQSNVGFSYSFSKTQLQPVEYSQIPDFEKYFAKEVEKFAKSLKKKTKTSLFFLHPKTDFTALNSVVQIKNISAAHTKTKIDETLIEFTAEIDYPDGRKFAKKYTNSSRVKMNKQWPDWVGATKSAKFAIENIFKDVLNDDEFISSLKTQNQKIFFEQDAPKFIINDEPDAVKKSDFESRLKRLDLLRESGSISEKEYIEKRQSIINEL